MQFNITDDRSNKDCPSALTRHEAKEFFLNLYYSEPFTSRLQLPKLEMVQDRMVLRCDKESLGFKAYAAERVIASIKEDVLVYCAPRTGHAAVAIAELAKMYGKKAVFFSPACAEPTTHQACVIALGAELRFVKIAAMPVLNSYAKKWAEQHGARFLPFGLANMPMITAGIVKLADDITKQYGEPKEFWCATSTGTMIRGLQLGWPNSNPRTVAVARNIHEGEIGCADIVSSELPFLKPSKVQPPFPTTACYDAKAWERCLSHGSPGSVFINVGSDSVIDNIAKNVNLKEIDSKRKWHDFKDLERGL